MKTTLNIKGMHCHSCEFLIGEALEDIGVKSSINSKKGTAIVQFDDSKISLDQIKKAISDEGDYTVE